MYNKEIPGEIDLEDQKALEFLAKKVPKHGIIIELGSLFGLSSWCLAKSCDPTVTVHCVDSWDGIFVPPGGGVRGVWDSGLETKQKSLWGQQLSEKQHIHYTKGCHNIIRHKIRIEKFTREWSGGKVDLVYVDCFTKTKERFKDCLRKWKINLKPNGIISGHDYSNKFRNKVGIQYMATEFSQEIVTFDNCTTWYFKNVS